MGLSTSKDLKLQYNDSREDLIAMVKEQADKGAFDCRLLSGYGKDCLNKNLLKLLGLTDCDSNPNK